MEILMYIVILLAVILVVGLMYLASLPSRLDISVSLPMNVAAEKVYAEVANFRTWPKWSPWFLHEPDTKLTFNGGDGEEGSSYSWDGKYVGAGSITHTRLDPNKAIESRLDFTRPFRSTSESGWKFTADGDKTEVEWYMKGKMPFLFRFMTKRIQQGVRQDYQLGLALLNQQMDPKAAKLKIEFKGKEHLEGFFGCYDSYKGSLADLPSAVSQSFSKLMGQVKEGNISMVAKPRIVYHKMNPRTQMTECDSVLPVSKDEDVQPLREYPGGDFFHVQLIGDYKYLPNAWYVAMSHMQMKKMKFNWHKPSMEVYSTNPFDTKSSSEYITDLYIPLR